MLRVVYSLHQLSIGKLMEVYAGSTGGSLRAEQEMYQYLREGFFTRPGDRYCLWEEGGQVLSALRLQTYRDGLLLEALETAPAYRRQGCARALVQAVLAEADSPKVYVHIENGNKTSILLHEKCGFFKILDHAVYADGSVTGRAGTWLFEKEKMP